MLTPTFCPKYLAKITVIVNVCVIFAAKIQFYCDITQSFAFFRPYMDFAPFTPHRACFVPTGAFFNHIKGRFVGQTYDIVYFCTAETIL